MTRFFNLDSGEYKKFTNDQTIKNLETLKSLNAKFYVKKGIFNYSLNKKTDSILKPIKNIDLVYSLIEKI